MQTLAQIRELLESYGLRPKKSLGQNFLIDHNLLRKLLDASGVEPGDLVLEVGPGTGTLTEELLARGAEVVACEMDDDLARLLTDRLGSHERFRLVHGDCLARDRTLAPAILESLGASGDVRPFRLISNLPYGAATPLLSTLLIEHPRCVSMSVTIQREMADRLCAAPGSRTYGAVSIIAQVLSKVSRIATLPGSCFWPPPDVASAMVHLGRLERPLTDDARGLSELCRVLFATRRKQLRSILGDVRLPAGVRPTDRPEALTAAQVIELLELRRIPES